MNTLIFIKVCSLIIFEAQAPSDCVPKKVPEEKNFFFPLLYFTSAVAGD